MAEAKHGAWPQAVPGHYPADDVHLAHYAELARTEEGFQRYLAEVMQDSGLGREAAE